MFMRSSTDLKLSTSIGIYLETFQILGIDSLSLYLCLLLILNVIFSLCLDLESLKNKPHAP